MCIAYDLGISKVTRGFRIRGSLILGRMPELDKATFANYTRRVRRPRLGVHLSLSSGYAANDQSEPRARLELLSAFA